MASVKPSHRPPVTYQRVMEVFKHSNPLIQAVVLAFFSEPKDKAHAFLQQLIDGIIADAHGTEEARTDAAEGLQYLIDASNKMTEEEREFLRLRIRHEWML